MASTDSSLFSYDSSDRKEKAPNALRTISEASEMLDVPQHVLRFWETKFPQIKPLKRNGGRRFYRPQDLDVLQQIKHLLYSQGYTIKGAKKAVDEFIHARAEGVTANEWAAPVASVNDNYVPEELDLLAELAQALQEPLEEEVVVAITPAVAAAVTVEMAPSPSREKLAELRNELLSARDTLRAFLPRLEPVAQEA